MKRRNKFVVLSHYNYPGKQDHLDVIIEGFSLLEEENPLMKFETMDELKAIQTADYKSNVRLRYLTYEGPMNGGRGEIRRVDGGEWYINDQGEIIFNGINISGRYILALRRIE